MQEESFLYFDTLQKTVNHWLTMCMYGYTYGVLHKVQT